MTAIGEKPFRGRQLWRWVYNRGATDFAAMTDLAKDFRARLTGSHTVTRPRVVSRASQRNPRRTRRSKRQASTACIGSP